MKCNQECKQVTKLYSQKELQLAKLQYPNYEVVMAENIRHKGNKKVIETRAIIYAPVGNSDMFWSDCKEQLKIPKIILVGFSTSKGAMEEYYRLCKENDYKTSCKLSSFSGYKTLRNNIVRMFSFLGLGTQFNLDKMFEPGQTDIMYTQIVKCCSLGKINENYKDSSAIYPNNICDEKIKDIYLNDSGHRKCVDNVFMKEVDFDAQIPLVLIFKPAWQNLKSMNLLPRINAKVIEWVPHPSNPGPKVNEFLSKYENGEDISKYTCKTPSVKQLLDLKQLLSNSLIV